MRFAHKLSILFLLAAVAATTGAKPRAVLLRVTVDRLSQILDTLPQKQDGDAAHAIAALELTERPGSQQAAHWKNEIQGRRAGAALLAVVDEAAFLAPSPADVPADPAPDLQALDGIFARAQQYVKQTVPRLPNFSALRSSTDFELASPSEIDGEQFESQLFRSNAARGVSVQREDLGPMTAVPLAHLYLDGVWKSTVTYRDGKEVADASSGAARGSGGRQQLTTRGEFGPILFVVMSDAAHGKITWSHWERGPKSRLAVFHFEIPHDYAHYAVQAVASGAIGFPAYHGEIAIDPATGSIYRITVEAWQRESSQVQESGIAVDYETVTIGGHAYICPVHGAAFLKLFSPYIDEDAQPEPAAWYEGLNDVTFTQYHVFRGETRILP